MKTLFLAMNSLLLVVAVHAQQVAPLGSDQVDAERARIEADRAREKTRIEKEEADCYQRFAVNDCLRDVHARRRAVMEELRRQEIILNDADRKRRAQEQTREIDEKSTARTQSDEAQKRQAARQQSEERARRAEQKKSASSAPGKGAPPPQAGASASQAKTAQRRAEDKKAFEEKQLAAQKRKAERDKALAEKTGRPAKPLPDPP
jgi:colicin import membrane protein